MNTRATASTLDLHAYLDRIHFSAGVGLDAREPSLALLRALHEAHLLAVPFENLSIHYGQPIVLVEGALYDKIVRRHRGGFCYELNGLFAWLLRRLGFAVSLLSAGVATADGTYTPEYDHLALLVHQLDGADWLADVGFGDSFRQPLRMQAEVAQDGADGHLYRLRRDDRHHDVPDDHVLRPSWIIEHNGDMHWKPHYRFTLQPHTLADFAARCVYQQTSPASHFTRQRICSLVLPQGRVTLSDLRLIMTLQGKHEERVLRSEEEYRDVLAARFGIVL